jgi:ribonucleotide reductase alpha subunit
MNQFAQTIFLQKYSHTKKDGTQETWEELANRVTKNVMRCVDAPKGLKDDIRKAITERKFIPGGRYLYAAGRPYHQVQNCLLLRAEDSREGWSELLQKASLALMTGAGIGVDYSDIRAEGKAIRKTGGTATGPLALMQMVNEAGRGIMQGGSRRSAIWAGLNWKHPDIHKFITIKNWSDDIKSLKSKNFSFPATLDGTNISVLLDDEFFEAYHSDKHPNHSFALSVYWSTVKQMLMTAEPGFSIDIGDNKNETLRNAPVSANTYVLTLNGYERIGDILDIYPTLWTGKQWKQTQFKKTGEMVPVIKVKMTGDREIICEPNHEFILDNEERVKAKDLQEGDSLKISLPKIESSPLGSKEYYTLGYIYGDGTFHKKWPRAEATLCTEESKKCLIGFDKSMTTSINYSDSRGYTRIYFKNSNLLEKRYKEVFPEDLYEEDIEKQTHFIAGLFDADGNYFEEQNRIRVASKHKSFLIGVRRLLEQLGILSGISTAGISTYGQTQGYMLTVNTEYVNKFIDLIPTIRLQPIYCKAYRKTKIKVLSIEDAGYEDVYCCDVKVKEHSFMAEGVIISNCTEITSKDDSDICNLGSINLSRIGSLDEMEATVRLGSTFLLAGTVYSDVPYAKVDSIRTKNRRLGLGLMGIHEWLLAHGKKYGPDSELEKYLEVYMQSGLISSEYAYKWDLSVPVKTRAIAPTGSLSILAETTSGIEPLFCAAYKRRYRKGDSWQYQYVIDPIAKKLVDSGINPDNIEDAYTLAENVEKRIEMQAWVQNYVDHAISSTINLPAWGTELNNENTVVNFGNTLMKYLPKLRGVTVYPDGCRNGQPLNAVKYQTAIKNIGEIFEESGDVCDLTKGGTCNS